MDANIARSERQLQQRLGQMPKGAENEKGHTRHSSGYLSCPVNKPTKKKEKELRNVKICYLDCALAIKYEDVSKTKKLFFCSALAVQPNYLKCGL